MMIKFYLEESLIQYTLDSNGYLLATFPDPKAHCFYCMERMIRGDYKNTMLLEVNPLGRQFSWCKPYRGLRIYPNE